MTWRTPHIVGEHAQAPRTVDADRRRKVGPKQRAFGSRQPAFLARPCGLGPRHHPKAASANGPCVMLTP